MAARVDCLDMQKGAQTSSNRLPTGRDHMIAGFFGGLISTAALYPLELIKTRMQVQENTHGMYRNIGSSLRIILKGEGIKGFYQGLTPAIIGNCGSWAGYFYFYENAKQRKLSQKPSTETKLQTVDHLLAGTEAGVILVMIFNPLWLTKTRLALQGAVDTPKPYKGFLDALVTIARDEGLAGLYKGVVPALFLTSHGAIQFATYEWLKTETEGIRDSSGAQPALISMGTGALAKIFASTITYPYQVVKSRLQQRDLISVNSTLEKINSSGSVNSVISSNYSANNVNGTNSIVHSINENMNVIKEEIIPKYTGTLDCIKKIWRYEGAMGFFRGVFPNALKVAPAAALTFLVYEECLKILTSPSTLRGSGSAGDTMREVLLRDEKNKGS